MGKDKQISLDAIIDRLKENQERPAKDKQPQPEQRPQSGQQPQPQQKPQPGQQPNQKGDGSTDKKTKSEELEAFVKEETEKGLKQIFDLIPGFKQSAFNWPTIEKAPAFPDTVGGRLPSSIKAIKQNRSDSKINPREAKVILQSRQSTKQCLKKLKICLFFDGTDSHEKADSAVNQCENKPDNIMCPVLSIFSENYCLADSI